MEATILGNRSCYLMRVQCLFWNNHISYYKLFIFWKKGDSTYFTRSKVVHQDALYRLYPRCSMAEQSLCIDHPNTGSKPSQLLCVGDTRTMGDNLLDCPLDGQGKLGAPPGIVAHFQADTSSLVIDWCAIQRQHFRMCQFSDQVGGQICIHKVWHA